MVHPRGRFEHAFEEAAVGMALLTRDLRLERINAAACALLGRPAEDLAGVALGELTHPDDRALPLASAPEPAVRRCLRGDGTVVDVQVTAAPAGDGHWLALLQDVTARRRAEARSEAVAALGRRALAVTEPRRLMDEAMRVAAATLGIEHCVVLEDGGDGGLRLVASATDGVPWVRALPRDGSPAGHTLDTGAPVRVADLEIAVRFEVPRRLLAAGMRRSVSVPVKRRQGIEQVVVAYGGAQRAPFDLDDVQFLEAVANVLALALDRAADEDELRRRALEDPLTGLANRVLLERELDRALHRAARHGGRVAVLMLDLDRFKVVNDTLGHAAGDELLLAVAERLRRCVREEDVVARLGGDEFVVVAADHVGDSGIARLAGRVVDALAEPLAVAGRVLHPRASVGVAVGRGGDATAKGLLRDADVAMYRAKEQGGGRHELFDAALRRRLVARVTREDELRRAVERDELRLHWQPAVSLADGRVRALEALVRWQHPERGLLPPAAFVPIAEEGELIHALGDWVLRAVIAQAREWGPRVDELGVRLGANVSARQVTPELPGRLEQLLAQAGAPASRLGLEITESLLMDGEGAAAILRGVRELGVVVALDDFGTGYSSLGFLREHRIDAVKLDRSFVATLDSPGSAGVLRAAIDMARNLRLGVIAEGIERRRELELLRRLGCPLGQGYLFARPLPPAGAAALLAAGAVPLRTARAASLPSRTA